jgi:eukaryotic-like serine/threonine-protein kinase
MNAPRGIRFGKYTLLNRIAVGGMAEIFLARQEGLEGFEKTICIKRIRPHLSSQANFVRMFLNEAKLAAQLNHPNIVQIYDLGRINDSYFIAMEFISGRDMSRIVPKAERANIPFPMIYALRIASSVCEGLYYAHTKTDAFGNTLNVVHRDVTPENILVSWDGTMKIVDFGIAKANTQIEQTRAGEIKGKLSYMSPEQAMGKQLDARSDLFSLGAVLYEWVTGYKLFTGENEMAILRSIIDGKIYPPSYFKEDVPEHVERILMKALEKDRERRYQSAWEMQFDIDTYLAGSEFTPSNIHLSNFLKQIFEDEIEKEKEMVLKSRQVQVQMQALAAAEGVLELEDLGGRALTDEGIMAPVPSDSEDSRRRPSMPTHGGRPGSKLETRLTVPLTKKELDDLLGLAKQHKLTPEELVRELLRDHLKWLA